MNYLTLDKVLPRMFLYHLFVLVTVLQIEKYKKVTPIKQGSAKSLTCKIKNSAIHMVGECSTIMVCSVRDVVKNLFKSRNAGVQRNARSLGLNLFIENEIERRLMNTVKIIVRLTEFLKANPLGNSYLPMPYALDVAQIKSSTFIILKRVSLGGIIL